MNHPTRRRCIAAAAWIVLAHAWWSAALGQPVVRDVLDRVEVERSGQFRAVRIYFRFPVHYVRHFPFEWGETLLIHVTTTRFEKREDDAPHREALRPPDDPDVPLTDIVYDETTLWSPYLMLHFSRAAGFRVRQGQDFRSIVVELLPWTPSPSTLSATPVEQKEKPAP